MKPSFPFRPTLVTVIVLVATVSFFPTWLLAKRAYRERQIVHYMSRECHPVWKDLHAGRIRAGQPVEEIVTLTRSARIDRFDSFAVLNYQGGDDAGICFTGVTIIAHDGHLIDAEAWSCGWKKSFFREWTSAEESQFWPQYWAFRDAQVP